MQQLHVSASCRSSHQQKKEASEAAAIEQPRRLQVHFSHTFVCAQVAMAGTSCPSEMQVLPAGLPQMLGSKRFESVALLR